MPSTMRHQFALVRTKTGSYCHPIRLERHDNTYQQPDGSELRRLGCMSHPTHVWYLSPEELIASERGDEGSYKPCIACAMWLIYGRERPEKLERPNT